MYSMYSSSFLSAKKKKKIDQYKSATVSAEINSCIPKENIFGMPIT